MLNNISFSIITTCYNDKTGLIRTLNSIKKQTYKNYESIVIDGGSTDGSVDIIKTSTIINRYISQKDNGVYDAMNKGINLSKNDYIIFLNSGDTFFNPYILENISNILSSNPQIKFLYGDANIIHSDLTSSFREYTKPINKSNICHQSIFYAKELFSNFGNYDLNLKIFADYDLNLRLIHTHSIIPYHINIPICNFYEGGISSNPKYKEKQILDRKLLKQKWPNLSKLKNLPPIQFLDSPQSLNFNKYQQINNQFNQTLVYRLGDSAGLFSEINNMIFALIWALDNNVKFELNSQNSNIGKLGWNKYFQPFTTENSSPFLNKFNTRYQTSTKKSINKQIKNYKIQHNITYLTQDIFKLFFENPNFCNKTFNISSLNLTGNSFSIASHFAKAIYTLTPKTKKEIKEQIALLNLPKDYISLQIRSGDIITECNWRKQKLLTPIQYVKHLKNLKLKTQNLFIFTDDYSHIKSFKKLLPQYKIYTLCTPNETGFVYNNFTKLDEHSRHLDIIKILSNIEICKNSKHFIGTRVSNPSWFLSLIMPQQNISFIDCPRLLWQHQYDQEFFNKKQKYTLRFILFNIIPLLKITHTPTKINIKLFNFIPIYKIKKQKHYLLGFIPIIKKQISPIIS